MSVVARRSWTWPVFAIDETGAKVLQRVTVRLWVRRARRRATRLTLKSGEKT
jgi:hypothetical protein